MSDERIYVAQDTLLAAGENTWVPKKGNKMGFAVMMDFYTQMAIEGRIFNVTAGTISVPLVGDVVLTDAKAEMAVDAASATTIIPIFTNVSVNLGTGTLHEYAGKSVATVSSAGDAFTPLNLLAGGSAAVSTARVDAAGGVTVTAETATTTLRHWSWSQPIAMGAYFATYDWQPRTPPVLVGPRCYYVQIAATTTGPSYFASIDYIELPTANVS
jgi:hypothetical protein